MLYPSVQCNCWFKWIRNHFIKEIRKIGGFSSTNMLILTQKLGFQGWWGAFILPCYVSNHILKKKKKALSARFDFSTAMFGWLLRTYTSDSTPLEPILFLTNRLPHISSPVQLLSNHTPVPINIKSVVPAGVRRQESDTLAIIQRSTSSLVHQLFHQLSR